MIGIGIVGTGCIANAHAVSYGEIPQAKVVAICQSEPGEGQELAQKTGAKLYSDIKSFLQDPDIEIVSVCTPTYLHKEHVLQAAAVGKHLICEKPLARSLVEGEAMIEACEKADVRLFVAHVLRFFPEYILAKKIIDEGRIGKPAVARTSRNGGFPGGWQNWYANPQLSGGPILDLLIHDFDFLRWCFGEVERVYAKALTEHRLPNLDYALVTLRFRNGVLAHCEGSWAHPAGTFFTRLEVTGSEGMLEHDSRKTVPLTLAQRDQKAAGAQGVIIPESPLSESPYTTELRHFIDCLTRNTEPLVTANDALKALEIGLAALESAKTGKPRSLEP